MEGKQLQQTARSVAGSLPRVSNGRPFTETLDVYKVADKVFLIVTDNSDELIITVKTEPDCGCALRREYSTIVRDRYLDKEHWVSVGAAGRAARAEVTNKPLFRPRPTITAGRRIGTSTTFHYVRPSEAEGPYWPTRVRTSRL
ncbi:MmcQ/YjbR family DNA-binding protein [Citricoccus sp. I39-566]|uniref:MmcQ/YjbR family DNA-binding protein n=1 Tax=Citricoccus sp. I39-566 TaxID=3073268 RepID=UPI00286B1281|nr:MmcQ/YjbR family DNA-binding protein [Citricoccus sp. I39-566]WMY77861.1 MmcQ/YjbR family DNA-binding protein [Citricoccus sp. I39-566]